MVRSVLYFDGLHNARSFLKKIEKYLAIQTEKTHFHGEIKKSNAQYSNYFTRFMIASLNAFNSNKKIEQQ